MMPKHIGAIIDKSYYQSYNIKDKYGNIHLYKICKICDEPIDLGFSKDENSGFACTLPHICEQFKELLLSNTPINTISGLSKYEKKYEKELEWGQFIFLSKH